MTKAKTYAAIVSEVDAILARHREENDPTVIAYMTARASLLAIRGLRGSGRAAELAYNLADELAGET